MIGLDELAVTTQASLRGKPGYADLTLEQTRQILEEANFVVGLARDEGTMPSRRIIVRAVSLRGAKEQTDIQEGLPFSYRRTLVPGLNGWIAGNSAGKSTILKAIVWALTGVSPSFKADVRGWLTDVAIEFEILGDGIYTIRYQPREGQPKVVGAIYAHSLDTVLTSSTILPAITTFNDSGPMASAITDFFAERLGFYALESVEWRKGSFAPTQRSIAWDVYAQAFFIGADDYSDYLFPRRDANAKQHQNTLAMLLGLDTIEAVSRLKALSEQAKGEYEFQKRRIEANTVEVRSKIAHAEEQLRQVKARIDAIDNGESVVVDPSYVSKVREKIATALERIHTLTDSEQTLVNEERQLRLDRGKARREAQILREMIEFRYFFSGIPVDHCPHCEQAVTQERISTEQMTGKCRVCSSDLRPTPSSEHHEEALAAMERHLTMLDQSHRRIERSLRAHRQQIAQTETLVTQYQAELADLPRQERAGFSNELRDLLAQQGFWQGQLAEFNTQTTSAQTERLQELRQKHDIFQTAHRTLQADVLHEHQALLDDLGERTLRYAQAFGVRNLERVALSQQFEMFITQAGKTNRYVDMDMSEELRIKIAFHLALLTLRSVDHVGRHPGLLIIDAPGNGEMDTQRLGAIVEGFAAVKEQLGDQMQLLIATTRSELADICGDDGAETAEPGATLF